MRPLSVFVHASTQLRYCETCLVGGFHAAWFQWQPLERCPLHNQRFRSGCFECAAPIPYILGTELASSPLRCSNCRCNWVPVLHRSAGRCSPFRRRDRERIRQWANYVNYVNDVITVDQRLHRDWCNGKYVAAKPGLVARRRDHEFETVLPAVWRGGQTSPVDHAPPGRCSMIFHVYVTCCVSACPPKTFYCRYRPIRLTLHLYGKNRATLLRLTRAACAGKIRCNPAANLP